jgi:hypothetical protein
MVLAHPALLTTRFQEREIQQIRSARSDLRGVSCGLQIVPADRAGAGYANVQQSPERLLDVTPVC